MGAEMVLTDLSGLKRGSLRLAASQTVANYWLPPLMHRYRMAHPAIVLSLAIGNTETVADMVRDGVSDLGFVEGAVDDPALSIMPVGEDELVLVTDARAKKKRRNFTPAELLAMRWVFRERGSATRSIFEAAIAKLGINAAEMNIILELPSNEAVRAAVEDGAGATVMSKLAVAGAIASGTLVAHDLALPKRQFYAVRHKERYVTGAERELMSLIVPTVSRRVKNAER